MSDLRKSKRLDLIDKFNDSSRYLDDKFIIDNPEFAEHIPDVYQRELQLNKVNKSFKSLCASPTCIRVIFLVGEKSRLI